MTRSWSGRTLAVVLMSFTIAGGLATVVFAGDHGLAAGAVRSRSTASARHGLVAILGVLRRPQTPGDRDPTLMRLLAQRSQGPFGSLMGMPVRSLIRLAAVTPWGYKVFLVPFRAPTKQALAKLPARVRHGAARRLANEGRGLRLGVFAGGEGCCVTARDLEADGAWISGGPSPNWLVVVVPDGVAKVKLLLDHGQRDRHPHAIEATVHGNVAAFRTGEAVEGLSANEMIWLTPSGTIVRRIGKAGP